MNYTTKQLAEITGSELFGNPNLVVKNISYDSRKIFSLEENAFIAINTTQNSGEKYIESAIDKGVKVIITENLPSDFKNCTWIIVENAVSFLQNLARYHLEEFHLKTIGITGSNGKTVIKEWLFQCLNDDFSVVKSPKSFNSQIGLPLSILEINKRHEIGLFEVGISKPKEMELQERVLSPKIGILTHIGSAHSANFNSLEELIREKLKLFTHSETIIFNGDNHLVFRIINEMYSSKELISYGLGSHNKIHTYGDWKNRKEEVHVKVFSENFSFFSSKRDEATISNALCVISVLQFFGYKQEKIIEKLNTLKSVEMRLESVEGERNNLIINDSFNLDLDSLTIAFQFIKEYNKEKKVLILTDFLEGKDSSELFYQNVAHLTNEQNFNAVFLVGTEITRFSSFFHANTFSFNYTTELIESQNLKNINNSLILLKGARKFEIEKVKSSLELQKHDTVLEVNLNAILHNINVHKSLLKKETKIMAMVKAFSYGLGGYEIAEFLQHHHIDYLGVAYADEGVDLRKNGITTPIVVMNPEQHSYSTIIEYRLEPEIYSFRVLDLFYNTLLEKGINMDYPIHIKLETGMHRLGFKEDELDTLIERLKTMNLKVASIFSHLSSSDIPEEKEYTTQQIEIFTKNSNQLINGLGYRPLRHILNSSGITNFAEFQFDMVRIGIGMIGVSSNPEIKKLLQSAVVFKTVVSQISQISEGQTVGYSRKFKANENTAIATLPVGYADGIPRLIGNKTGNVAIKGELFPIIGNICMDMMMVEIKNTPVQEGDEVILFNSKPSLEEFANYCKTIPYEVLTSISRRVKRIYIKN